MSFQLPANKSYVKMTAPDATSTWIDRGIRFQVHACKPIAIIFCYGAKQTQEGKVRTYYCKNESQKSMDDKLL